MFLQITDKMIYSTLNYQCKQRFDRSVHSAWNNLDEPSEMVDQYALQSI